MLFEIAERVVGDVPNMTPKQGRIVHDFIIATNSKHCLELGFASGSGSCFMGAAVHDIGGTLICIDNQSAKNRRPTAASQIERAGLSDCVNLIYAHSSYTWELMKLIEAQTIDGVCHPCFDFCYVDGAHEWEPDGLAFFLVDKLLKRGGWILFDDLHWTWATSSVSKADRVRCKSKEEQETAQVRKIFRLLVKQHPNYGNLREVDWWGWAQKTEGQEMSDEVFNIIGVQQPPLSSVKSALRPAVLKLRKLFGG